MSKAQISLWEEKIVDSFAGGGGASTGIELATGRVVDIAINHDPDAILMHKTNHPHTTHYQASVWDVDPLEVTHGSPVGLLWASPDCKHFSKAKGGKPVEKKIRGLAWIVLRWAGTVRPRVIILENVEEFQTWGAGPQRQARQKAIRPDVPQVAGPVGGPGLHRGMAGTGGGGLRSAHHTKAVFPDRQVRRAAHCVARTHTRAGGQPGGKGGPEKAVEERGGDHRLEPARPLYFCQQGGNPGTVRRGRCSPTGQEHHAPRGPWRGQVRDQIGNTVYCPDGVRRGTRTAAPFA